MKKISDQLRALMSRAVTQDPDLSTRALSERFGVSRGQATKILHAEGWAYDNSKKVWVRV